METTSDGTEVRQAAASDTFALAEVWLRSRRASIPAIPPAVHSDDDVREWFRLVVLPTKDVWMTISEGVATAVLVLDDGWVDQLYVDPSHTGRGIGSTLLAWAKRRQPAGLCLWTFQSNHGARRFYERHGFEAVEFDDGNNEEGAPSVRYRWTPGP